MLTASNSTPPQTMGQEKPVCLPSSLCILPEISIQRMFFLRGWVVQLHKPNRMLRDTSLRAIAWKGALEATGSSLPVSLKFTGGDRGGTPSHFPAAPSQYALPGDWDLCHRTSSYSHGHSHSHSKLPLAEGLLIFPGREAGKHSSMAGYSQCSHSSANSMGNSVLLYSFGSTNTGLNSKTQPRTQI